MHDAGRAHRRVGDLRVGHAEPGSRPAGVAPSEVDDAVPLRESALDVLDDRGSVRQVLLDGQVLQIGQVPVVERNAGAVEPTGAWDEPRRAVGGVKSDGKIRHTVSFSCDKPMLTKAGSW